MSDRIEERLDRLEQAIESVAKAVEQLANAVLNKPAANNQAKQSDSKQAKYTLKQGRAGYLLFLNNYKIVRGKPMAILSGKELSQLRAEIDRLLRNKSGKKVSRKEGFENALR